MFKNFLKKKSQENGPLAEKWQNRMCNRTSQKNERRGKKEESNDREKQKQTKKVINHKRN